MSLIFKIRHGVISQTLLLITISIIWAIKNHLKQCSLKPQFKNRDLFVHLFSKKNCSKSKSNCKLKASTIVQGFCSRLQINRLSVNKFQYFNF